MCSTTDASRIARTAQSAKSSRFRNAEYASSGCAPRKTSRFPATCPTRKAIRITPVTAMTIFLPTVVRQRSSTRLIPVRRSRCGHAPSGRIETQLARSIESAGDVAPVEYVPAGSEEVRFAILVLKVVGVLPGVEHQEGYAALAQVRLVIVDLGDEKPLAERLPDQRGPTRAHDR